MAPRSFGPADRAAVQDYLDRFATAMTSGDTKTVASLCGVPAFVIGKNEARVVESDDDRATVEATLTAGGEVTATCRGTFVAVKPGHPAYHRW